MKNLRLFPLAGLILLISLQYMNCGSYEGISYTPIDLNSESSTDSPNNTNTNPDPGNNPPPPTNPPPSSGTTDLAKKATELLVKNCAGCHGPNHGNVGGFTDITNTDGLINQKQIIPGSAQTSRIFLSLTGSGGIMLMPNTLNALTKDEVNIVGQWINGGAKSAGMVVMEPAPDILATYQNISKTILQPKCVECHGSRGAKGRVRYDTYQETLKTVNISSPEQSKLYYSTVDGFMPPAPYPVLSKNEVDLILKWIKAGALNN